MSKKWIFVIVMAIAAAAAFAEGWIITRPGIGISPDSIVYMASARNMMQGHGISTPAANGHDVPLTHFPPGYPIVLAALSYFFGHTIFPAARWLNILLFGANTILIAAWVYRRTERVSLAAFSAVIGVSALDLLRIYSMAWTEPLFLFLTFGGLWLLDVYLDRPSLSLLLGAAFLAAAAVMTRYAGIAGAGAGMLILFLCQKKPAVQKLKEAAFFGGVAGIPVALWLARNILLTHDATTRKFVFHPVLGQIGQAAQSTLSLWLFQGRLPPSWTAPVGIAVIGFFGFLWMRYKKPVLSPHLLVPLIFSFSYILLMAVIIFFFEAQLLVPDEYDRILCPLHVAFLLTFLTAFSNGVWPRIARYLFSAVAIVLSCFFVYASVGDIREYSQDGQQFASADWQTSPTIEVVRHLSPAMHVYTNGRMPIYLYLNRPCFEIPPKILLSTLQPNADYQKVMERIGVEVRRGSAVVVDFTIEDLPQFPTLSEWKALLHQSPLKTDDGYIFVS